jgi:alkylation response protein AidB-like acyl-CoA dehydrogenase
MTTLAPSATSLLRSVRDLRPLIEAEAPEIERQHRITPRVIEALREAGVYRMLVPHQYGGSQLTLWEFAEVMEAIAEADASTAWTVGQNSGICKVAAYLPPEGAEEIFGDPTTILSWGNGPGTARKVEGGYVIDFKATYSSGMHHATWLGTQDCETYDSDGNLVLDRFGQKLRGTCFFRPEDVTVHEIWNVSGLKGTGTDCYTVTDLFIPEHRFACEMPVIAEPLYLFNTTNIFATGFAAVALGVARATLDALVDITATKSQRGTSGPLREQRPVLARLGVAEATLRSARALLHEVVLGGWERVSTNRDLDMQTRVDIRMATTSAMQRAAEVVDTAYKQAGIDAVFEHNPFERRFRDMHAMSQHVQARDDHFEKVGQFLTGLEPDKAWL